MYHPVESVKYILLVRFLIIAEASFPHLQDSTAHLAAHARCLNSKGILFQCLENFSIFLFLMHFMYMNVLHLL